MAYTLDSIPDLSGRVAVVTGANGGLGFETAKALAAKGAHVVMAVRDQEKAATAIARIREATPDAALELVELDLGSQASATRAAREIAERHPSIDILVNNAGVMASPEGRTVDGYETQLGIDHLGHWTFTALLLPSLLAAPAARVVTVTSTAHHFGRAIDPDRPYPPGRYRAWLAYGTAKLANYHFGLGLHDRFADGGRAGPESHRPPRALAQRSAAAHGARGRRRRARTVLRARGRVDRHGRRPRARCRRSGRRRIRPRRAASSTARGSSTTGGRCGSPSCVPGADARSPGSGSSPSGRPASRSLVENGLKIT